MKIKLGTVREDVTCYGNRFWIQIEDSSTEDNRGLKSLVDKPVTVVIGESLESNSKAFTDVKSPDESLSGLHLRGYF